MPIVEDYESNVVLDFIFIEFISCYMQLIELIHELHSLQVASIEFKLGFGHVRVSWALDSCLPCRNGPFQLGSVIIVVHLRMGAYHGCNSHIH